MSVTDLELTMQRIKDATPESPIAVFKCSKPGRVDSMFATAIETAKRVARGDPLLVGVFHGDMNLEAIRAKVKAAVSW